MLELAHSGDFFLAFPAIDALAALQDPRIAIRLVPLLNDDLVRISVIDALGRLGDDQTVAPLAELLATSGPHLVPAASALVSLDMNSSA